MSTGCCSAAISIWPTSARTSTCVWRFPSTVAAAWPVELAGVEGDDIVVEVEEDEEVVLPLQQIQRTRLVFQGATR